MNWLTGWGFRKKITVQDVYVDSDLTEFPFYVPIKADANFHEARADGFDIRFTQSDGTTLLKYAREYWTGGDGRAATAHFWVKIPSILATGGATIYCYYGKADAPDGEDAPNVWDANFKGVWHLKDITPSTIADSTGVNDGTKKAANEPIEADGKVYKGQDFDGLDDYVNCGNNESLRITEAITIVAWVKPIQTGMNASARIVDKGTKYLLERGADALGIKGTVRVDGRWRSSPIIAWDDEVLNHYAMTYSSVTHEIKIYKNGEYEGKTTLLGLANYEIETSAGILQIGGIADRWWKGLVDEVRISNVARTDAWLKFEHYNINEADNEITWGIERGNLPIIFNVVPRQRILEVEARTRIHNISPRGRIFDRRST